MCRFIVNLYIYYWCIYLYLAEFKLVCVVFLFFLNIIDVNILILVFFFSANASLCPAINFLANIKFTFLFLSFFMLPQYMTPMLLFCVSRVLVQYLPRKQFESVVVSETCVYTHTHTQTDFCFTCTKSLSSLHRVFFSFHVGRLIPHSSVQTQRSRKRLLQPHSPSGCL